MSEAMTTRFGGTIERWLGNGKHGFIQTDSGDQIFFGHARVRRGIPMVGLRVTFEVDVDREGRPLAAKVDVLDG